MIMRFTLVAAMLAGASVVGYLYLQSLVYYPVVRMALPEGLMIAAVLAETKERKVCESRTARFIGAFKQCKDCTVTAAGCERRLQGVELALREDAALPYPTIVSGDTRVVYMGPPEAARLSCQLAAKQIVSSSRSATCRLPRLGDAKS